MEIIKSKIQYAILIVLILLSTVTIGFHVFFMKVSVTSGSMETTIMTGDHLLIKKTKSVNRGDIVCFKSSELGRILVKRLIGLPGDKVTFREGVLFVNGEKVQEDYVSTFYEYNGEFDVPKDSYFFLGDNRADSFDARFWSNPYIHKSAIIGRSILNLSR